MAVHGTILDSLPDSWGRRVIHEEMWGGRGQGEALVDAGEREYMLGSGSDRIGGLDFQESAEFSPRSGEGASIADMLDAAAALEFGRPVPERLRHALAAGSTAGGARPKALLRDERGSWIAKFPSITDSAPAVKWEALGMDLARRAGIDTAQTRLVAAGGRDVLLVRRFDRRADGSRRLQVSGATILGINPDLSRGRTSYPALADAICLRFTDPVQTLHELYRRMVFNILIRNIDDHARNTAAFWDGRWLTLTPAYDLTPSASRADTVATHPMGITRDDRRSLLSLARAAAPAFLLDPASADEVITQITDTVHDRFDDAADHARLTGPERNGLLGSSVLNPAIHWNP
jgi:serine/threonine-protein kinase HipA